MMHDRFQLAHECIREDVAPTLCTTEWFANFRGKVAGALQAACQDRHLEQSFDDTASHATRQVERFRAAHLFARVQASTPGAAVADADAADVDASLAIIDRVCKADTVFATAVDTARLEQSVKALVRVLSTNVVQFLACTN